MARLKQYNPGGVILPADLNRIEDDYESAFSIYKTIQATVVPAAVFTSSTAGGTYLANTGGAVPPQDVGNDQMWLDPADYASAGRTARMRVKIQALCNGIAAPAMNFTAGLYPISTFGGASGNNPTIATLGTVVSGSQAVITAPAVGSSNAVAGTDFAAPTAGWYTLGILLSGTPAANSSTWVRVQLQMRQT